MTEINELHALIERQRKALADIRSLVKDHKKSKDPTLAAPALTIDCYCATDAEVARSLDAWREKHPEHNSRRSRA